MYLKVIGCSCYTCLPRTAPAAAQSGQKTAASGTGTGAPPVPWVARVDARRRYETVAGVREVRGSLKTTNCRGAGTHCRTSRAQFRRGGAWVPGQRTWGVPWGYGDALARVFRSSGAAEGRGRGGGCYALGRARQRLGFRRCWHAGIAAGDHGRFVARSC